MALQYAPNLLGPLIMPGPPNWNELGVANYTNRTMDALGESYFGIGHWLWEDGGSHVVSSAGAELYWYSGAVTFANGATNLRGGIQDVSSGLEDGTFDVRFDLVGGTDPISANSLITTPFETGSKTIAHLALVAVGLEMTARGGADSVVARSLATMTSQNPYLSVDSGSGPTRAAAIPVFAVKADDGTIGWFLGGTIPYTDDVLAISDAANPDELAIILEMPWPFTIQIPVAWLNSAAAADTFDFKWHSDPLGASPVLEKSVSVDPTNSANSTTTGQYHGVFSTAFEGEANTLYALSIRATANALNVPRITLPNADLRAATLLGRNWRQGSRQNNTGAFTEATTILPRIGFHVSRLDDGVGGGGGGGDVTAPIFGGLVVR